MDYELDILDKVTGLIVDNELLILPIAPLSGLIVTERERLRQVFSQWSMQASTDGTAGLLLRHYRSIRTSIQMLEACSNSNSRLLLPCLQSMQSDLETLFPDLQTTD